MIKTVYLGWELEVVESDGDGGWVASYYNNFYINGTGHTPESALADAQRKIQRTEHGD